MRTWLPEKETFKFRGYKRENLSICNLNLFRKYYSSDKLHKNNSPSATIQHQPHSSGRDSEIQALFPQTGLTLFSTFSVFLKSNAGKGIHMVPSSRTSQLFLQMIPPQNVTVLVISSILLGVSTCGCQMKTIYFMACVLFYF